MIDYWLLIADLSQTIILLSKVSDLLFAILSRFPQLWAGCHGNQQEGFVPTSNLKLRNRWFRNCGNVTFHHRQFFIDYSQTHQTTQVSDDWWVMIDEFVTSAPSGTVSIQMLNLSDLWCNNKGNGLVLDFFCIFAVEI